MRTAPSRQGGATLLVTLVMLIMLTLFALSAMNTSTTNLKMVGNMQMRSEAFDASQRTIEQVISTSDFARTPSNALKNTCGPNTVCTDLNNDGQSDLTTQLVPAPACIQARAVKVAELVIVNPQSDDVACLTAQAQGTFGVAGANTQGDSLCATTVWNITARTLTTGASETNSDVNVTTTQGVGVRIAALDLESACK